MLLSITSWIRVKLNPVDNVSNTPHQEADYKNVLLIDPVPQYTSDRNHQAIEQCKTDAINPMLASVRPRSSRKEGRTILKIWRFSLVKEKSNPEKNKWVPICKGYWSFSLRRSYNFRLLFYFFFNPPQPFHYFYSRPTLSQGRGAKTMNII